MTSCRLALSAQHRLSSKARALHLALLFIACVHSSACGKPPPELPDDPPPPPDIYGFEDLVQNEWGFEPLKTTGDKRAQAGIDQVFRGDAFKLRIPVELFRSAAKRGFLDISQNAMWEWLGNAPSPTSRGRMGDPRRRTGIGLSVFSIENSTTQFINFNCFSCHAGVVAGQLVAGIANAHADQYAQTQGLYLFEDMNHTYKDLTEQKASWGVLHAVARKQKEFQKDVILSKIGTELGMNDREIDEALHHLKWFSVYSETILAPALGNAQARGDNLGPFGVWKLMARLKDPNKSGFEVYTHFEPTEVDREIAYRLDAVHRLRQEDPASTTPMVERLDTYLREHPLPAGTARPSDALWVMPTVDPNAWWQRKFKTKSYWYLDSSATERGAKDFAVNFHVPHDDANETYADRTKVIADVLHASTGMLSPPYPRMGEIDDERVERGRSHYNRACASCHGAVVDASPPPADKNGQKWVLTYRTQKDRDGKDERLDCRIHDVGTDPVYSDVLKAFRPLVERMNGVASYYGKGGAGESHGVNVDDVAFGYNSTDDGYMAPPLVGVWASPPYLHNGSVPTLRDLLGKKGPERPVIWARSLVPTAYSYENVGLQIETTTADKVPPKPRTVVDVLTADPLFQSDEAVRHRNFFNALDFGKSNAGHDVTLSSTETCDGVLVARGDSTSESCLESVLEFLRVLNDQTTAPDARVHDDCPGYRRPSLVDERPASVKKVTKGGKGKKPSKAVKRSKRSGAKSKGR
jgi:cytochrome c5